MDNSLFRLFVPCKKRPDMSPELAAVIDASDREIARELAAKTAEFTHSNYKTQDALAEMLDEIDRNHPAPESRTL
jgi:hypothetical protein